MAADTEGNEGADDVAAGTGHQKLGQAALFDFYGPDLKDAALGGVGAGGFEVEEDDGFGGL